MVYIRFGKRKCPTDKTPQPLAQCIVPSFNMCCFTTVFTNRLMVLAQQAKYLVIRLPQVAKCGALSIRCWYPRPQTPTTLFATVTNKVGNYLACSTAQGCPNQSFLFLDSTNDHNSSNSSTSSGCAFSSGGISGNESAVSLSHLATVWRATPKVRSIPRKLERSW